MTQPSELFVNVFNSRCAGLRRECACGRVAFDEDLEERWDWDEGEHEELCKKHFEDEDRYLMMEGAVGTLNLGTEVVIGCNCTSDVYTELIEVRRLTKTGECYVDAGKVKEGGTKATKQEVEGS